MMVLKEIGIWKAIKYFLGMFQLTILRCGILPPNIRRHLLRLFGANIGKNTIVHPIIFINLYRKGLKGLHTGQKCFIGEDCLLDLATNISLGENVTLAERVTILTHLNVGFKDHPLQGDFPSLTSPVIINAGSFIGTNATILPGITIGRESFIAAGAVVTKNVLSRTVVAGIPARVIRNLNDG